MPEPFDPRYLGYFDCFNRGDYFEAHEVLEGLWLECRDERRDFFKGLIQLAAVFVKLKQNKLDPAQRIAGRATGHLSKYPACYEAFRLSAAMGLLENVRCGTNPLTGQAAPRLTLETL